MDQNKFKMFGSITQELPAYFNFDAIFEFLGQFTIRCIYFQKDVDYFEIRAQNMPILDRRCSTPLNATTLNYHLPKTWIHLIRHL